MNNYLIDFPEILATFNVAKNTEIKVDQIKKNCNAKIWWTCLKGHEWQARVQDRTQGKGCPACSGRVATPDRNLKTERPDLLQEWNYNKNAKKPTDYLPSSGKKVWWKCHNDHEWQATIDKRNQGRGCPFCAGKYATDKNNLKVVFPDIASEWHPTKNGKLTPCQIQPVARKKVWWKCKKGHEYECLICERTSGSKSCKQCFSLAEIRPDIAAEWHSTKNGTLKPENITHGNHKSVYWQCAKFKDHVWKSSISNRTGVKNSGCPFCRASKGEQAIRIILEEMKINYKTQFRFDNCKNKRCLPFDFAIFPHNQKIHLIEFQGEQHFKPVSYWGGKKKWEQVKANDQIKQEYCKKESIPLLILSYEDKDLRCKINNFVSHCR